MSEADIMSEADREQQEAEVEDSTSASRKQNRGRQVLEMIGEAPGQGIIPEDDRDQDV